MINFISKKDCLRELSSPLTELTCQPEPQVSLQRADSPCRVHSLERLNFDSPSSQPSKGPEKRTEAFSPNFPFFHKVEVPIYRSRQKKIIINKSKKTIFLATDQEFERKSVFLCISGLSRKKIHTLCSLMIKYTKEFRI